MTEKIHCDLLDIKGLDWDRVSNEQIECIITAIHNMELMGSKGELYGFVGTADIDSVVGGFFIIQFPTQFLSYDRDRTALRQETTPAERVFFVFFPRDGRILLQNRRFQILPIDMSVVQSRLKGMLAKVLSSCGVGPVVSLVETMVEVGRDALIEAYNSSNRVARLQITRPDPKLIPEGFEYYNPERDRNEILRDSRLHDYPQLKEINLTARKDHDLRNTHLGQDLVYAAREMTPFMLEFDDEYNRHRVLRRLVKAKFEFYADIETEKLPEETLRHVVEILEQEAALYISTPVSEPHDPQPRLF